MLRKWENPGAWVLKIFQFLDGAPGDLPCKGLIVPPGNPESMLVKKNALFTMAVVFNEIVYKFYGTVTAFVRKMYDFRD